MNVLDLIERIFIGDRAKAAGGDLARIAFEFPLYSDDLKMQFADQEKIANPQFDECGVKARVAERLIPGLGFGIGRRRSPSRRRRKNFEATLSNRVRASNPEYARRPLVSCRLEPFGPEFVDAPPRLPGRRTSEGRATSRGDEPNASAKRTATPVEIPGGLLTSSERDWRATPKKK